MRKAYQKRIIPLYMTSVFDHQNTQVIHCAHHKAGSFWIARILQEISKNHVLEFKILDWGVNNISLYPDADILYDNHSMVVLDRENYIGSHMIRDPRDVIISGYFYHLWTSETWAHEHSVEFGMSYQQKLNSFSKSKGIEFEMAHIGSDSIGNMRNWSFNDPKILELKYEELIADPDVIFEGLFKHWRVGASYLDECMEISRKYHMFNQTGRKLGQVDPRSHMRSGLPGQWKEHFTELHTQQFKEKFGDILIKLGYEKNNDW
jgi:hypothetical protein